MKFFHENLYDFFMMSVNSSGEGLGVEIQRAFMNLNKNGCNN